MRTQDEIVAYVRAGGQLLSWRVDVCVPYLDYEHAKEWLSPRVLAAEWRPLALDDYEVRDKLGEYIALAWTRAQEHRGISASRNIEKLGTWVWLLGRGDIVNAMELVPYPQFGAPKLKVFCQWMGFDVPEDEDLVRMMRGEPCVPRCELGCMR